MSELRVVDRVILRVLLARLRTAVDGHNKTHKDIGDFLRFGVYRGQIAVLIRMIRRFSKKHPEAWYEIAEALDLIGATSTVKSATEALAKLADEVDPA